MAEESPGGYTGKILRVDLSTGQTTVEEPDNKFYRQYFGGTALIGYYLLKELKPGIDPLGPENKLVFSAGVIAGLPAAGCGRSGVGAKSPLTGGWGDGQAGGFWPAELKHAGWDAIIIEGKSDKPVYIWIKDDKVEIRDAAQLWGKTTAEAQQQIRDELGDNRIRVTQIGPAGEKLVRIAAIANDINRYYGRCGLGAVMGSKMLKAIAVRGTSPVKVANQEKVREIAGATAEIISKFMGGFASFGTAGGVSGLNSMGILPTKNFSEGQFDGFESITGQNMAETILVDKDNCTACNVNCKRVVEVGPPYNVDRIYGGPEYETIGSLGSLCCVSDIKAIAHGNQTCNAMGLDTIGTGTTIAFAMECFENGILTEKDTGGIDLRFGNAEAMMKMVEMIAKREGLGDILAEGSKRAAEKIGKGAIQYAMQIKGQELPMHDPRGKVGLGMGYATSPTGADHMHNIHDVEFMRVNPTMLALGIQEPLDPHDLGPAKVRAFWYLVNWAHFKNCATICMFLPYDPNRMSELVSAATGWNTNTWELEKVGERALAMTKLFNAREGITAKDDVIPERLYSGVSTGPQKDRGIDREAFKAALKSYYEMAGWGADTAAPNAAKLAELDLAWAIPELDKIPG
ncbi:MAG TPA: aldehyde ferredoxin oxidoreductase family protein [Dehalococcoidia bacterium]|nr:aldehyde ferredoxin oxidoreductase family protein [Dehalococcoidia bacterium]